MSFHASRVCDNVSFPGDMPIGSPVSTRCLCWRKQKLEALEGRSHMLIGQRQKARAQLAHSRGACVGSCWCTRNLPLARSNLLRQVLGSSSRSPCAALHLGTQHSLLDRWRAWTCSLAGEVSHPARWSLSWGCFLISEAIGSPLPKSWQIVNSSL